MKWIVLLFVAVALTGLNNFRSFGQTHQVYMRHACGFDTIPRNEYTCLNQPAADMQTLVYKMIRYNGIGIKTMTVQDCRQVRFPVTTIDADSNLTIVMNASKLRGAPRWILAVILAHELGHVYRGDMSMVRDVNRTDELNADAYAGHWAHGAGCTKVDSIIAGYKNLATDAIHPASQLRIDSVTAGWNAYRPEFFAVNAYNTLPSSNVYGVSSLSSYSSVLHGFGRRGYAENIVPFANRIVAPKHSRNWLTTWFVGLYGHSLGIFAMISPHVSEDDHKKSKDFEITMHLSSSNPLLPLEFLLPQIKKVTYSFDKSNLIKPVIDSYNINHDDYGYTVTGIWSTVTVHCMVYFKDGSVLPVNKTFKIH